MRIPGSSAVSGVMGGRHRHFWERALTRRTFVKGAAGLAATLLVGGIVAASLAWRHHAASPPVPGSAQDTAAPPVEPVRVASYVHNHEALDRLGQLVAEKRLTLRVAETFPPERAADAQRKMAAGGTRGRLVIAFQGVTR